MYPSRRRPGRAPLTAQEFQLRELLASGIADTEIRARLDIAPRSPDERVANLTRKLKARNRRHAVAVAYRKCLRRTDRRLPLLRMNDFTGGAEIGRPAAAPGAGIRHG